MKSVLKDWHRSYNNSRPNKLGSLNVNTKKKKLIFSQNTLCSYGTHGWIWIAPPPPPPPLDTVSPKKNIFKKKKKKIIFSPKFFVPIGPTGGKWIWAPPPPKSWIQAPERTYSSKTTTKCSAWYLITLKIWNITLYYFIGACARMTVPKYVPF